MSLDWYLPFIIGLFLGLFVGNRKFRDSILVSIMGLMGRKPKQTTKGNSGNTTTETHRTAEGDVHIHIHKESRDR